MKSEFHFRHGHTFLSSSTAQPALIFTQCRDRCLPASLSSTVKMSRRSVYKSPFCTEVETVGAVPAHPHTVQQTAELYLHTPIRYSRRQGCSCTPPYGTADDRAVPAHLHTVQQTVELYLHTPIRYSRRQSCCRQLCDVLSRDHTYDSVLTAPVAPLFCSAVCGNKRKYCVIRTLCLQTPERQVMWDCRGSSPHAH